MSNNRSSNPSRQRPHPDQRIESNGRSVEWNHYFGTDICHECDREIHEGLGCIQHHKDCSFRTERDDDDDDGEDENEPQGGLCGSQGDT